MASKQEMCPFCGARKVFGDSDGSSKFNCGTTGPDVNGEYDTGHCCDIHTYNRLLARKDEEIALLRKALSDLRQLRRSDPVPWLDIDAILEDALGG